MTVNSTIKSYGGKGTQIQQLLAYFPHPSRYDVFVDAYGGAGTVLLNKPYAEVEVFNDLNRNIYALMTCLVDDELFERLRHLCELALYDEATSIEYKRSLRRDELDTVTRAFQFWYVNRTRRGGGAGGFFVNTVVRRNMSKSTSDFLSSVDGLPDLHQRLSSVVVRNVDALKLISEFDRQRCAIYCDPPYVHSTRTSTRYEVDADDDHHHSLVDVLNGVEHALVVLSGYDNPIYDGLNDQFLKFQFDVRTVTGTNVPKIKTETVWTNFDPFGINNMPLFANGDHDEL